MSLSHKTLPLSVPSTNLGPHSLVATDVTQRWEGGERDARVPEVPATSKGASDILLPRGPPGLSDLVRTEEQAKDLLPHNRRI